MAREKARGTFGKWKRDHPDLAREALRSWNAANPHARAVHMSRYRAKFGAARASGDLTPDQWADRLEEFGYACAYCLRTDRPLTQDHVIAIANGGAHTIENVVPACRPCNSRKGKRGVLVMLGVTSSGS